MVLVAPLRAAAFLPGDGHGRPEHDCFIGLAGYAEEDLVPIGTKGKKVGFVCTDCDPACDDDVWLDGATEPNGSCSFLVAVRVNDPDVPGCTPQPLVTIRAQARSRGTRLPLASDADAPTDGSAWTSPFVRFPVEVRAFGRRRPKTGLGKVTLFAREPKDKDVFHFRCLPRPAGESCEEPVTTPTSTTAPPPTTTTTPATTTTSTVTVSATTTSSTTTSVTTTSSTTTSTTTTSTTTTTGTTLPGQLPPDPAAVAPPVDETVVDDLLATTAFLYTGANPIQTDVTPAAIEPRRVAVVRGGVRDPTGAALGGVRVSVLDQPALGRTLTRTDGRFDLVVNGGGLLTLEYARDGFLPAQRQVLAPWRDWVEAPPVVLVPLDPVATVVDLAAPVAMQVARGSPVSDADGDRQATLLVPQGTTAELVRPDGTRSALATLTIRATEFTVGAAGPEAMPAVLPPTSGYTYAVELSVDEALAAGATTVEFDRPLPFYVENFLGFPAGTAVPLGYYDRVRAQWVPSPDGRVVDVLGETGGLADLDVTGDGVADGGAALVALGITDAERETLAQLYAPGASLWRAPIPHLTPWDCNWPFGPPDDAEAPDVDPPTDDLYDESCLVDGSIVGCEGQVLGESVPVEGTPYALEYWSDRVPGRRPRLEIQVSGDRVPASLEAMRVSVAVAGQVHVEEFAPAPNVTTTFVWDGRDAYGRPVQGAQRATVRIAYEYPAVYRDPRDASRTFAALGGGAAITGDRARQTLTITRTFRRTLVADARGYGLGGWTLDVHHTYDPTRRMLLRGDGRRYRAETLGSTVTEVEPGFSVALRGPIAVAADGSIYAATDEGGAGRRRVRRLTPDGVESIVAGSSGSLLPRPYGDGGVATAASLLLPGPIALGPAGALDVADVNVVRRVGRDGIIRTVAGRRNDDLASGNEGCTSGTGFGADDVPATDARLCVSVLGTDIATGSDGSLYARDAGRQGSFRPRVVRIDAGGHLTTVIGGFPSCSLRACGDGGPALAAAIAEQGGIAAAPDGTFYVGNGELIRRIGLDGVVRRVAGTQGRLGFGGDGGPATGALLDNVGDLLVAEDGTVVFIDGQNFRIRRITPDGIIETIAGIGRCNAPSPSGTPALSACLDRLPEGWLAHGPDGALHLSSRGRPVRRISPPLPGFAVSDLLVASDRSSELYVFDQTGRHLRTLDGLTHTVLRRFEYDAAGRLARIVAETGGTDRVTTIERNAAGAPTAIVAPFGERTALALDANGFLAGITNPALETVALTSTGDGLLTTLTDARGATWTYTYDPFGRLERDDDPLGGRRELDATALAASVVVTRTTALGHITTHLVEALAGDGERRTIERSDGTQVVAEHVPDPGMVTTTHPDGLVTTVQSGPDPRFGMTAPLLTGFSVALPGGTEVTGSAARTVSLADEADPLSLLEQTDAITVAGATTVVEWDATARTLTLLSPGGRLSVLTLDARGRLATVEPAGLAPSALAYDALGRLERITTGAGPSARETTLTYDGTGRPVAVTNPEGETLGLVYDAAGRVTESVRPDGERVAFGWDAASNLVSITPPGREAVVFGHDARGDLVSVARPAVPGGGGPTLYGVDADRRLVSVTRPDGDVMTLGYDAGSRRVSRTLSRGGVDVAAYTNVYDAAGRVVERSAPGGVVVSHVYDGPFRLADEWTGPVAGTVARTLDDAFRAATETVNGADEVAFAYDDDGFLTGAGALALTRDAATGLPAAATLGQVSDAWTYDEFGGTASHTVTDGATTLFAERFVRDRLGRALERRETIGGVERVFTYRYDPLGQLLEVRRDGLLVEEYAYDANGNRTSATRGGVTVTATHDAQDRLASQGGADFVFDPNGLLVQRIGGAGTTTYGYDARALLETADLPGGRTVGYVLDAQGRRIGKRVDGTLVQGFLYRDGLRPVAELDGDGAVVSRFVHAGGVVPAWMTRDGARYRLIVDDVGSVRLVVDADTGTVVQRLDYDAFGAVVTDTNPGFQPFGFAGGLLDRDTGLVHVGVREYDPATGRFTSRDPIGFASGVTNLFAYAGNDPVNDSDPFGLLASDETNVVWGLGWGAAQAAWGVLEVAGLGNMLALPVDNWMQVFNYEGDVLDLLLDMLDLETTVDRGSGAFIAGQICGALGFGLASGGIGASLDDVARSATNVADDVARAATSSADDLSMAAKREALLAEKLARDNARRIAKEKARAAEENGLQLVKDAVGGNLKRAHNRVPRGG